MGKNAKMGSSLQSGQVIILVAISMIALLGMAGLAIDGGRLLFLRRDAQNANDAAVLSSVFALCTGGTEAQVIAAGEATASANGFTDNVEQTIVVVDPDPAGLPSDACAECSVAVTITRDIQPYFIQLVYSGQLEVTTYAVGTCTPDSVPVDDDTDNNGIPDADEPQLAAFWGGAPTGACNQPAVDLAGSDIIIKGNIHSNSDIDMNPSNQVGNSTCDSIPGTLNGGWTFGQITYSESGGDSGFQDSKSANCAWNDSPGVVVEPPVCGASCLTQNDDDDEAQDHVEPTQIDPFVDDDGNIIWPVDATIDDFRVGGAAYNTYNTDTTNTTYDKFFTWNGNYPSCNGAGGSMEIDDIPAVFKNNDGTLKEGIYYSKCNMDLDGDDFDTATATFVAEGEISVNHPMDVTGFYEDLVFFANGPAPNTDSVLPDGGPTCTGNGIHISSSDSTFTGVIFAPNGNAQFSASSNSATVMGCIVAYITKNSSSGLEITCEPESSDTRGTISFQQ
jgi:Putative Flp pilus-assembly TadE/G-like